ncbi:MAG: TRAP transporter substrate-binding protein [Clostridiales bacterium]|jgi:tripartite ATP-independent transporter DctP family solute receptor|nr:TRAP transporter substrate-binding protein [Clostridiales bacterium]
MKKVIALVLAALMPLAMAACGGGGSTAQTTAATTVATTAATTEATTAATTAAPEVNVASANIILGHFGAPGEPVTEAAELFKKTVEDLSNGAITVEIHGASVLGNAKEMAEQTEIGAIQACLISEGSLDKYDLRYALVGSPYLYSSYDHAYAVVDGPFADWVRDGTLESKGLHNLGPWDYGFRCLTNSVREVKTPADVSGLKIRTPLEIQKVACFESMGADVSQINFNELITALKQGTVDGQENPLSTIFNNSMWEANQTYLSLTRHTWEAVNLTVSNTWWTGLDDTQRGMIEEAHATARDFMRNAVQSGEQDYITKLADAGVTVTEIDMAEFQAAMTPAYERIAEYVGSQDDMDKFLEMVADIAP